MMTLKELCRYYRENQLDEVKCEWAKNQYLVSNKDKFDYEDLDESDIVGLRPYLMCWALAIYEYLAHCSNHVIKEWFYKYEDVYCNKQDDDYYKSLLELQEMINPDKDSALAIVNSVYDSMQSKATLEEFKRRGIGLSKLYDIA